MRLHICSENPELIATVSQLCFFVAFAMSPAAVHRSPQELLAWKISHFGELTIAGASF